MYVDPSGHFFLTWGSDGHGRFSIGLNFGLFGFGIDFGNGYVGVYGELGPRIGNYGATLRGGIGYDFSTNSVNGYLGMSASLQTPLGMLGVSYTIGNWNLGNFTYNDSQTLSKEQAEINQVINDFFEELGNVVTRMQEINQYGMPVDDITFLKEANTSYTLKPVQWEGYGVVAGQCYWISYNLIIRLGGNPGPDLTGQFEFKKWKEEGASFLLNPLPNTFGYQVFYRTGSDHIEHVCVYIYEGGPKYFTYYTDGWSYPKLEKIFLGGWPAHADLRILYDQVRYVPVGFLTDLYHYKFLLDS